MSGQKLRNNCYQNFSVILIEILLSLINLKYINLLLNMAAKNTQKKLLS